MSERFTIIAPPHHKVAAAVTSWKEIAEEATALVEFCEASVRSKDTSRPAYAIAQPQVSHEPKAYFVLNRKNDYVRDNFPHAIVVNPKLSDGITAIVSTEGCFSHPHRDMKHGRWEKVTMRYQRPLRIPLIGTFLVPARKIQLEKLAAIIAQHEVEHLMGLDHLPKERAAAWSQR